MVDLPGRGRTFVVDIPGPDGQPEPPTLLLLHSLACTAYLSWYPALDELARHYRVVMLDQRWHGRGIRSSRFRLSDCADDAAALLDVLGIDRCVPVGYSMGGPVAQLMWRRHRDRVAGLVLCATARNYRGKTRERLFFPFLTGGMLALSPYCRSRVDRVATALPEVPLAPAEIPDWALREFRSTSAWAMPAVIKELGRFNSAAWIGDVDVPTAVVVTAKDHTIPVRRQRRLAESIDGATVHEVAGGHSAIVLGAAAFVPALLEACASVTARLTADHGFLTGRQVR
jgi:pimeloyl-ACP methyl ester carboxylesterase